MYIPFNAYIKHKKCVINVADVMNLLFTDNGSIKYQQLATTEILPLSTFAGILTLSITLNALSILQSHFTQPLFYQPQIRTIEDIY